MPIPFLNRCKLSPSLPTVHWVATIHSHHATRTKSSFLDAYAFGGHICSLLFSDELKIVSIFVYENNLWRFPLMTCHEVSNTSHGYFTYSFRRSRFGCLQLKILPSLYFSGNVDVVSQCSPVSYTNVVCKFSFIIRSSVLFSKGTNPRFQHFLITDNLLFWP